MDANNESANDIVAPFVLKTYQMVNDPLTDTFITWGSANNSFLVLDPLHFSHTLLPAYFKHNNFSSFVRQLNTYGFRKVDPDRWEFANQWFLRDQFHLLRNIVRRKQSTNSSLREMGDEELVTEIARLRKEQKVLEEELEGMKKRLETTEKRPQQMMAFLHKVAEDPEILPRMMLQKDRPGPHIGDKKRRLMISSSSSSPSTTTVTTTSLEAEEIEEEGSWRPNFSSPEVSGPAGFCNHVQRWNLAEAEAGGMDISRSRGGGEMKNSTEMMGTVEESNPAPPYPFSLFGCGF
ncbi:heat stress transcription factor C-1-like [Cucurbita pepo subsp. pepo]|uniref:heat stress transcription factor C-1-like n=1 Tax=Cucurbita pepo subsp. pepo TaxID=3664 RepID=UPI000C9D8559|nr:heat stress transcription factor C-1-like [Cucurbita pepo subsp. pepo]